MTRSSMGRLAVLLALGWLGCSGDIEGGAPSAGGPVSPGAPGALSPGAPLPAGPGQGGVGLPGVPPAGPPPSGPVPPAGSPPAAGGDVDLDPRSPFHGMPAGEAQFARLCARGAADKVALALCRKPAPALTGLKELQAAVGLAFRRETYKRGYGGKPIFLMQTHSQSIAARAVSPVNPRVILLDWDTNSAGYAPMPGTSQYSTTGLVGLGFARGEPFVELVAHDPKSADYNFYLVRFEQACSPAGCDHHDLYTPALEKNWTGVTVYQDVDLANTTSDCLRCHQPSGPGTKKILLIQEARATWTHWIGGHGNDDFENRETFRKTHLTQARYSSTPTIDDQYAGFPVFGAPIGGDNMDVALAAELEVFVRDTRQTQPVDFPSNVQNDPIPSPQWLALLGKSLRAEVPFPVAHHRTTPADPAKLARASASYAAVMQGKAARHSLVDLSDVFPDDPKVLGELGFRPMPGATGREVLVQMCQKCHNARVDRSLGRSRFDVEALAAMPRAGKDLAIQRILLPEGDRLRMPPARFGELPAESALAAAAELRK